MKHSNVNRSSIGSRAASPPRSSPRNWASRPTGSMLGNNKASPPRSRGGATAGAKPGSLADLQGQLDAALRENRHLREQRDILKKTLGLLSEPPLNATNGSTR